MTASHNPKEYNGYKVYWMDGAQISGEISDGMLKEILALDLFDSFKRIPLEEAIEERKVRMLGEEMDLAYLDYVMSMRQRSDDEIDRTIPDPDRLYSPQRRGQYPDAEAGGGSRLREFLYCSRTEGS